MSGRLPPAPGFGARVAIGDAAASLPSGPGQTLLTLSDRIQRVAEMANRRADEAAAEAGYEAGLAAGEATPGTVMEGGGIVARQAFNRGALEAGGRRLEIQARGELDRIAREHATDPAAFAAAATQYRDGVLSGLPQMARVRVAPALDAMARPYQRQIAEAQQRAVADERGATFVAALPGRLAAIERAALRAATDPAARADADREQAVLLGDLIAMGPRGAFTFDGVQYPADPTRAGRYTLEQIAELRTRAADTQVIGMARSMFQAGPQTAAWIDEFEQRALRGDIEGLRPDQARSISDAFRRDLAQQRASQTEAQRQARAALAGRMDADRAAIAESGAPVANITDSELAAAGYDVPQYRATERARMLGWQAGQDLAAMDTPQRAQEVADRFQPGTPLFLADADTARRVLDLARSRGAQIRAAALQDTIRDRAAELSAGAAQAVRHAQSVPAAWRGIIAGAAGTEGVPEFLATALIGRESGGRADAVSPRGARGPAQIMPATARDPGLGMPPLPEDAITDPARAIPWALGYYRRLLDRYAGDHELALMAYNWGFGNVDRWQAGGRTGAVPAETRAYVAALLPAAGGDPARAGFAPRPIVTPAEAAAAGQPPEWATRVSEEAALAAREVALRQMARTAPPDERAAVEAELAVVGDRAADNARLAAAWREELDRRDRAVQQDPAGYVVAQSPILTELQARVVQGDTAALPLLADGLEQEQRRQGIPEAQRQPLPRALAEGLGQSILTAQTPQAAFDRMQALRSSLGQDRLVQVLRQTTLTGGDQDTRRDAALVAATRIADAPALARQILAGAAVLRDSPPANLPAPRLQQDADTELGQAFAASPGARDAVIAAARAVYAAEMAAAGQLGAPYDSGRFREAVSRVAPTAAWNGYRVPVPTGMDGATLRRTLERLPPAAMDDAAAGGRRFTPAMLQHSAAQLVAVADGQFQILYSGMAVMSASRPGQPFILDVRGITPVEPVRRDPAARGRPQ